MAGLSAGGNTRRRLQRPCNAPARAAVDDLCRDVREQVALGHAIYPQGGRTALDYGGIPAGPAWRSTRPASAG